MFKFDVDAFKMELIKSDEKILRNYSQAYYGLTDMDMLAPAYKRLDQFCKFYNFEKNVIDCDWSYDVNFLTGEVIPKHATLYQYVISFNTPEDGQRPCILLNSLIYGVYDVCNILYDRFGMVPRKRGGWVDNYIIKVIFYEKDLGKLDKFINDQHVSVSNDECKSLLYMAVTEEWVEATALMLRFMKDHDIYEEQPALKL